MPIIEWNVGFMTGVKEVDQDHKNLVHLLNETYDEFRGGAKVDPAILERLAEYADHIFKVEENLMADLSFPNYPEHKREHEAFLSRLGGFRNQAKHGKDISIELLWFLCNWVTHHMRETDAELGRFADLHNINKKIRQRSHHGVHPRTRK